MTKQARLESLRRYENSARSVDDFQELATMYDDLDALRERRERRYEYGKSDYDLLYSESGLKDRSSSTGGLGTANDYAYSNGEVVPPPLCHPYWRELIRGDFINTIFDNADEIWQIFGDWQVGRLIKNLTIKQREALFLSAARLCSSEQIACYTDKTNRGVNKLIAAALEYIRKRLAELTRERIEAGLPVTYEKRRFLEWYDEQKNTPGEIPDE